VEQTGNIRVFKHTAMVGAYNNNLITAFQVGKAGDVFTERYIEIRSDSVVVATGCIERPLLFEHNERPGVMQVGCAHRLARTYGLLPGSEAVFSVGHDLGLEAAVDLFDLGVKINCVADIREDGQDPEPAAGPGRTQDPGAQGLGGRQGPRRQAGGKSHPLHRGRHGQARICLRSAGGLGRPHPGDRPLDPGPGQNGLRQPHRLLPAHELPEKMFPPVASPASTTPMPSRPPAAWPASRRQLPPVPTWNGHCRSRKNRGSGPARPGARLQAGHRPGQGPQELHLLRRGRHRQIGQTGHRHGFDVPELVKRFAGVGLGPGQGGIPGHNLPLFVAKYTAAIGTPVPTTVRPPLVPTFMATYAGYNHHMFKRTPLHDSQKADGGIFRNIGVWQRARYFSEDFDCKEEILNVRNNVGMLDGSTLGKFRIHGPDALKALQRVYVSDMSKVGRAASNTRPCATTTAASSTTAWWSSWAKTTTTSPPPPAGPGRPWNGSATTPVSTAGIFTWST
jgi:sarcosine oxidase subunit alpha